MQNHPRGKKTQKHWSVRCSLRTYLGDGSSVELNLHEVSLLLANWNFLDLGVGENPHNRAVPLDALEVLFDRLAVLLGPLFVILGESLGDTLLVLGTAVPVLVEPTLDRVGKVACPDGREGTKAAGSLDIAHNPYDYHGRGLDDRNGLDDLLFVHL